MPRSTKTDFQESFRVVVTTPWGKEYVGPYQTVGAAKGQRTTILGDRYGSRKTAVVERLTGTWEEVEL